MGMSTGMLMMNPMHMLLVKPIFLMECRSLVGISQFHEDWKSRLVKS